MSCAARELIVHAANASHSRGRSFRFCYFLDRHGAAQQYVAVFRIYLDRARVPYVVSQLRAHSLDKLNIVNAFLV